jgi:hypothetical protein
MNPVLRAVRRIEPANHQIHRRWGKFCETVSVGGLLRFDGNRRWKGVELNLRDRTVQLSRHRQHGERINRVVARFSKGA